MASMSSNSFQVLSLLLLLLRLTGAQTPFPQVYNYHACSGAIDSFQSTSVFATNLDQVLSSFLTLDQTKNGFHNLSVGIHSQQANSLALCRGDVSESSCLDCIKFGATDLPQRCPAQLGAIVWYDNCMFRYTNWYMFRSVEGTYETLSDHLYSSDTTLLKDQLFNLLKTLRDKASSGDSTLKYAVGDTEFTGSQRIYALVQCIPDLDQMQCANCLDRAFRDIMKFIRGKERGRVLGASCSLRFDTTQFFGIQANSPRLPTEGGRTGNLIKQQPQNKIVIVVSTLGSVALLIGICILILLKRRKAKHGSKGRHLLFSTYAHDITFTESLQFDFETIRVATDNFKSDNKLGQGGFGSVYKGKLIEGKEIAVKRLAAHSRQGDHEFTNEVVILAELQHRNLVRLLGYCLEGNERLLVYEFVPNSSLDHFLFDPLKSVHLDWEMRYKIISGIAKGILYLHEDSRLRIIHRDLKPGNILLDEEMCPKIADFGMARLFILNQTQADTTRIVGTYGYMAPEYAMHGKFSVKSDVYSFGILLLEIICGQKNSRFCIGDMPRKLSTFAWENWKAGTARNIIDPTVLDGHINDILRSIHIGLLCVQDSVSARPTMASVVLMLSSTSQYLPLPLKPAHLSSISRNDHHK